MSTLQPFYNKVNEQHNTTNLHAGNTCFACGRKQEWGKDLTLFKIILEALFIMLLFFLFHFVIVPNGSLDGKIIGSIIFGCCLWPISGAIVESLYAKVVKHKLDAYPNHECCPYIGDIKSIIASKQAYYDDARIKAILTAQLKEADERKKGRI